jgi:nitrate/TMAO reductase-like tetraheme cytochrome c subunit
MKRILPKVFYNPVSLAGGSIAVVSFGLILFLMILELLSKESKPYMGVIAFVILPAFMLIGIAIFIYGAIRENRRIKAGISKEYQFPVIDMNDPHQRRAVVFFTSAGILLLLFSAFGSYKAYEYTDSDAFCGELCHSVMSPEYTAYQVSPHSRVGCVKCHIGPGAGWFVRSKLSGTYQVYATIFNKYPRPIPTPIENLRPAQETCEQCHWPKHFYSEKQIVNDYYESDEKNTRWNLYLLMKVGGGNEEAGPTSGIHWHMNIKNKITYYALDKQRQIIPYIEVERLDGSKTTYKSTEIKFSKDDLQKAISRRMDCIDCHNRPTHIYHPPARSINHIISLGWINRKLPYIKSIAVQALEQDYTTKQVALDSIYQIIDEFYSLNYPEIYKSMKSDIEKAIQEVQKIYARNYFPEMRVSWKNHFDNIGHMYYPGCFRCHDGKHISEEGKILTKDCNTCHTIVSQSFENEPVRLSLNGLEYKHPVDIGRDWMEVNCSECHGKGKDVYENREHPETILSKK